VTQTPENVLNPSIMSRLSNAQSLYRESDYISIC